MIVLVRVSTLGEHELLTNAVTSAIDDDALSTRGSIIALTISYTRAHTRSRLNTDLNVITGCSNTSTVDCSHRYTVT